MNRQIILKSRPHGQASVDNFDIRQVEVPKIQNGDLLVNARYISVDPYMRGKMNEDKLKTSSYNLDKPIVGGVIAEVVESKKSGYKPGDLVLGTMLWQEIQTVKTSEVTLINEKTLPPEYYLGILGMPGLTAYFGMKEIGKPQPDQTAVISGAAGAVGMVAGQIARIHGCRVVGIAGSDEKIKFLKDVLLFDQVINYKWERNLTHAIEAACPNGVDVFFDNVGGLIADAVIGIINNNARIIICGQISQYNITEQSLGLRPQPILMRNNALMQGFTVNSYGAMYAEGIQVLSGWLRERKLLYHQTIVKGFENLPQAFIGLFYGANTGKLLVEV